MQRGAAEGNAVGGPVGGVVGGVLGGVAGGVGGFLGADQRPAFHDFVMREGCSYAEPVQPGLILPREGIVYYRVPPEYGVAPDYRYAIASQRTETTRRIVQVID